MDLIICIGSIGRYMKIKCARRLEKKITRI